MTSKQITDDATPLTHEIASRMGLRDIGATFHGDVWCPSFYISINCHSGWYYLPVGATVGQLRSLLHALGIKEQGIPTAQLAAANERVAALTKERDGLREVLLATLCSSKSALTWYQTQVHNAYETKQMANRGVQLLIDDAIDARHGGDIAGKAIKEIDAALAALSQAEGGAE